MSLSKLVQEVINRAEKERRAMEILDKFRVVVDKSVDSFQRIYNNLLQTGTLLFFGIAFIVTPLLVYATGGKIVSLDRLQDFSNEALWLNIAGISCLILSTICYSVKCLFTYLSFKEVSKKQPTSMDFGK
ncbi:hypothetical protein [Solidesulfovibrio alcoholivorans]|uniref:hypothetical protein n=1 Tax=Solidesulfovibrio alcoholivorans TaxID=81406 RepID=UPI0012EBCA02|nr:hypothetical protein [Solidesulfovibrio alcoholivorans]